MSVIGEIADCVTAAAAVFALVFYFVQTRDARHLADWEALWLLDEKIGVYWQRYLFSPAEQKNFHFGQLINFYETTCRMFNNNLLGKQVQMQLVSHIVQVMTEFMRDEASLSRIQNLQSGSDTFAEIIKFFREHRDEFADQWAFVQEWNAKA